MKKGLATVLFFVSSGGVRVRDCAAGVIRMDFRVLTPADWGKR